MADNDGTSYSPRKKKREREEGRKECTYAYLEDNVYNTRVQ